MELKQSHKGVLIGEGWTRERGEESAAVGAVDAVAVAGVSVGEIREVGA